MYTKEEFLEVLVGQINQTLLGQNVKAVYTETVKTNGIIRDGIRFERKDCNVSPVIYIDEMYSDYKKGEAMSTIAEEVKNIYETNKEPEGFDLKLVTNWEMAKSLVTVRLYNYDNNQEMVQSGPVHLFLDLAAVPYITIEEKDGIAGAHVTHNLMHAWNIDEECLWSHIQENMKHQGFECTNMSSVVTQMLSEGASDIPQDIVDEVTTEEYPLYVITNRSKTYGAAGMMYAEFLKDVCRKLKWEKCFVLPSSVHECLLLKYNGKNPEELKHMVTDVNQTMLVEEVLSDSVYLFDSEVSELTKVA